MSRTVVVKAGTGALTDANGTIDAQRIETISRQVASLMRDGERVVLVSSGAISAGLSGLGFASRPKDLPTLQAAASVGQRSLMDAYAAAMFTQDIQVGQVLLTRGEVAARKSYNNARSTLGRLLELGVLPIVNENDTVATEEIRYGDNDVLAALVANLVEADLLVMLSDVAGLYDGPPADTSSRVIPEVTKVTAEMLDSANGVSSRGSGGMRSKLEAAKMARFSGIRCVIANGGEPDVLTRITRGEAVGTSFLPRDGRVSARKLWIAFVPEVRGTLQVDEGAHAALTTGGKSLLAAGVLDSSGSYQAGDAVEVRGPDGQVFARGLVSFGSDVLASMGGLRGGQALIHRDRLVIL